jgi:hypothetical protein
LELYQENRSVLRIGAENTRGRLAIAIAIGIFAFVVLEMPMTFMGRIAHPLELIGWGAVGKIGLLRIDS